jgi:hypothetical protein
MKNTILGLLAATLVATPTLAASWKTEHFARIDADKSGELSAAEMTTVGCRVESKLFRYADADRNSALSRKEYFANRNLFGNCK